jgi:hypothetical protein
MKVKDLVEEIKGWKNAARDISSARQAKDQELSSFKLIKLKKDGKESGMHDATTWFKSEEEARKEAKRIQGLNPDRGIKYNLYHNSDLLDTI